MNFPDSKITEYSFVLHNAFISNQRLKGGVRDEEMEQKKQKKDIRTLKHTQTHPSGRPPARKLQ